MHACRTRHTPRHDATYTTSTRTPESHKATAPQGHDGSTPQQDQNATTPKHHNSTPPQCHNATPRRHRNRVISMWFQSLTRIEGKLSVAFISPAKSLTLSGFMENPLVGKKSYSPNLPWQNSRGNFPILSRDLENHQKPWRNSRFLKRTMAEKNEIGITPWKNAPKRTGPLRSLGA